MSQRIALVWGPEGQKWSLLGECDSNVNAKETHSRAPLVVCWLRFHTSTARDVGSIPCWGTKILHTVQYSPPPNFLIPKKETHKKQRRKRQKTEVLPLYWGYPKTSWANFWDSPPRTIRKDYMNRLKRNEGQGQFVSLHLHNHGLFRSQSSL